MSAEYEVRRRIQEQGKITFAEFIEIALYWPDGGYYTRGEAVGAQGDYYTSPSAHPAFGALLAVQIFQMWREMGRPNSFTVLELGAGNGLLCRDIITYTRSMPRQFADAIRYICVDRRTPEPLESGIKSASRILADGLPFKGFEGCILSNEYLDAFPVHQVVMTKDGLKEYYIGLEQGNLVVRTDALSKPSLAERFKELGISLAQGQTAEVNLSLDIWSQRLSAAVERGFVLTIDYGHIADDLYDFNVRPNGTLVTYQNHTQTDAPLTMIGSQDITSQVDFTSVSKSGKNAGLNTLGLVTQREFLSNLSLTVLQQHLASRNLSQRQMQTNRRGILDLTQHGGLGDFKILSQGKNVGSPKLWGMELSPEVDSIIRSLPVPLLTDQHLALPVGRSFWGDAGFETFWQFQ